MCNFTAIRLRLSRYWFGSRQWLLIAGSSLYFGCAVAQTTQPTILWSDPSPIGFATPLSSVQLNARVLSGPPVIVPLSSSYNVMGLTTKGHAVAAGGLDRQNSTFPAEGFGSVLHWRGVSLPMPPPDALNFTANQTVPLPQGSFSTLMMLGNMVNNDHPVGGTYQFTINYSDGTSTTTNQGMSDWVFPLNHAGEEIVACNQYRYTHSAIQPVSVCVYGYEIPLDPAKIALSLTLPSTRNVVILSMALLPPEATGSITYDPPPNAILPAGPATLQASFAGSGGSASEISTTVPLTVLPPTLPVSSSIVWSSPQPVVYGTQLGPTQLNAIATVDTEPIPVNIAPYAGIRAIAEDNAIDVTAGFDGKGLSYSSSQLGSTLSYAGGNFPLIEAVIPDAVTSTTLPLPFGVFSGLYLMGAANGVQLKQEFVVTYADGTSETTLLDMSSWENQSNFQGETTLASTAYAVNESGATVSGTYLVYGYQIPVNTSKTAVSLTLPQNRKVAVLALGLRPVMSAGPVTGAFVYTPASGNIPSVGSDPLAVIFSPSDSSDVLPTKGANILAVTKAPLTVTANSCTRLYGAPDPSFTGTISGAVAGDAFTESFVTTATASSEPGTYQIIPYASGTNQDSYDQDIVDGTLTVGKAPTIAAVSSSLLSIQSGGNITLNASILATTSGVPTGAVEFFSNGISLGTMPLANGMATLVNPPLAVGSAVISISYSGDSNFNNSAATALSPITVISTDFSFTAIGSTTLTTTPWGTASIVLHVVPLGTRYQSNLKLTYQDISSGRFSPTTVLQGAGAADVVFTVSGSPRAEVHQFGLAQISTLASLCTLFMFRLSSGKKLKNKITGVIFATLISAIFATALGGCGSGFYPTAIPFTVTSSDGIHTHTLQLMWRIEAPR